MTMMFLIGCEKDEVVPITEKGSVEDSTEASSADKELATDNGHEESQDPTEESNKEESSQDTTEIDEKASDVASEDKQETSSTNTSKEKETSSNKTEKSTEQQASKSAATPEVDEKKKSPTATQTAKTTPEVKTTPKEETKKEKVTAPPVVKKEEPKQTVTITIAGDQEKGTVLSSTKVEMSEGNTVLDITTKILKQKKIPISVTGSGSGAYVEGIANLFEFDRGPLSGWTVKKNGSTLDRSAGIVKVKNGDSIQWIYTTNYQEDES